MSADWQETYCAEKHDALAPWGIVERVTIWRKDGGSAGDASWEVLDQIKTDLFGADAYAVEFHPAEGVLPSPCDVRCLFVVPKVLLPFAHDFRLMMARMRSQHMADSWRDGIVNL